MNVKVAAYERGEVKAPRELDELAGVLIRERGALDDRIGVLSRQLSSRKMQAVVLGAAMVAAVVVASRVGSVAASNETKLVTAASENTSLQATNGALSSKVDELTKQKATLEADVRRATSARNESEARAGTLLSIVGLGDAPLEVAKLADLLGAFTGVATDAETDAQAALLQKLESCAAFEPARWAYLVQDKEGKGRFLVTATEKAVRVQRDGGTAGGELPLSPAGVIPVATAARGPLFVASSADGDVLLFDARHPGAFRRLAGSGSRVVTLAIGDEVDGDDPARIAVIGIDEVRKCHRWCVGATLDERIVGDEIDIGGDRVSCVAVGRSRVALLMEHAIWVMPAFVPGQDSKEKGGGWRAADFAAGETAAAHWSPDETQLVFTSPYAANQGERLSILRVTGPESAELVRQGWQKQSGWPIVAAWFTSPTTLLVRRHIRQGDDIAGKGPTLLDRLEHWSFRPGSSEPHLAGAIEFGGDATVTQVCVDVGAKGAMATVVAARGSEADKRVSVTRWLIEATGGVVFAGERVVASLALSPSEAQLGPDQSTVILRDLKHCYRLRFDAAVPAAEAPVTLKQWIANHCR